MFEKLLVQDILQNPVLLGLIFAIIRNIGGYAYNCFAAKKLLPYSASMLLETLTLYETFFIALSGLADLPASWAVTLTVAVDMIRSVKKAVEGIPAIPSPTPTPSPEPEPTPEPEPAPELEPTHLSQVNISSIGYGETNPSGQLTCALFSNLTITAWPATGERLAKITRQHGDSPTQDWGNENPVVIRNLQETENIKFYFEPIPTQTPAAPPGSYAVKIGDSFSNARIKEIILAGYKAWCFPDGTIHSILVPKEPCLGQTLTEVGWTGIMPPDWKPVETHQ
jgi:hypothetical protein